MLKAPDADKENSDRTLELLAKTFQGDGVLHGEATVDSEKIAAAIAFLQVQAREYLHLQMDRHGSSAVLHPRVRVCAYALQMLHDISENNRHPIHDFFRGAKPSSDIRSEDYFHQAAVIACAESILNTPDALKPSGLRRGQSWAVAMMKQHDALKKYLESQEQSAIEKLISRKGMGDNGKYRDKSVGRKIKEMRSFLDNNVPKTAQHVMDWTAIQLWAREGSLDLKAASTFERRRTLTVGPEGWAIAPSIPLRRSVPELPPSAE